MSEAPGDDTTPPSWASADDVRVIGGPLLLRPPDDLDVDRHVAIAAATVRARLHTTYGPTLPTLDATATELVRWAHAKLAAASVLSAMLAQLPESAQGTPTRLRAEGLADLDGPLPGVDPDTVDPDGPDGPLPPRVPVPVSRSAGHSLFEDPYAAQPLRGHPGPLWWEA